MYIYIYIYILFIACNLIQCSFLLIIQVRHIFREMKEFQLLGWQYRIEASFLEIYNEHIVDLLDSQTKNHEIKMADSKGQDLYVSNLKVEEINSPEELQKCLLIAQRNRAVAATLSNER